MDTTYERDGKALGRLAELFADPTRRGIYGHLREAATPLSAAEVAAVFGLHRTVARAHLERLTEVGLVACGSRRRSGGGRPAKTYVLSDERVEVALPPRRWERLSRGLLRVIAETLDPLEAERAAFAAGRASGEETAEEFAGNGASLPVSLLARAVERWMDAAGYTVSVVARDGAVVVEVRNCVYRELAVEHPDIVCSYDRGTMCGMFGVGAEAVTQTHSLSRGDDFCRHEFRL